MAKGYYHDNPELIGMQSPGNKNELNAIHGWSNEKCDLFELIYRRRNFYGVHFMVTPCINNIQHFNFQLMQTSLKNVVIKTF